MCHAGTYPRFCNDQSKRGERAYNRDLGAELSGVRAPGEDQGTKPLKLKAFGPFSYKRWAKSYGFKTSLPPSPRQTASYSHDQRLLLVNGEGEAAARCVHACNRPLCDNRSLFFTYYFTDEKLPPCANEIISKSVYI